MGNNNSNNLGMAFNDEMKTRKLITLGYCFSFLVLIVWFIKLNLELFGWPNYLHPTPDRFDWICAIVGISSFIGANICAVIYLYVKKGIDSLQ